MKLHKSLLIFGISLFLLVGCASDGSIGEESSANESDEIETVDDDPSSITKLGSNELILEELSNKTGVEIPEPTTEDFGDSLSNLYSFDSKAIVYTDIETDELLVAGYTQLSEEELRKELANEGVPISNDLEELIDKKEWFSLYETNYNDNRYVVEVFPFEENDEPSEVYRLIIFPL